MEKKKLVRYLISSKHTINEKAELLSKYLHMHDAVARNMGLSIQQMRKSAIDELYKFLPKKNKYAKEKLNTLFNEIINYSARLKEEYYNKCKAATVILRSLSQGTPIVVKNGDREDIVRLIETKRTRFVCEYPDGRRYIMPSDLFVRIHKGKGFGQLSDGERRKRELVRNLGSKKYCRFAKQEILKQNIDIIDFLLDELAATVNRIENAPSGLSTGVFRNSLGKVKKINPRDRALTQLIPEILVEIARKKGEKKVRKKIQVYPNNKIKDYCNKAFIKE